MALNPSLSNAIAQIEKKVAENLPVGMTTDDVEWFGLAGFNPQGKSKWARSSYTELDTTYIASGCGTTEGLYTLQMFYAVPTQGGIRNTMLDDLDALRSVFSLEYFEGVTIDKVTTANLGQENSGTWFNQNLILNFSIRGRI